MSRRRAFFEGAVDSLPMIVAAIPFGVLFGVLAPVNGVSAWVAVGISALVFAGSAQYVAMGLLASGTPAVLIVFTTFIVNLRHLLYSLALVIPFKNESRGKKLLLSFFLTDETFVTVNQRLHRGLPESRTVAYYLGSALFMYSNWQVCTWIGLWAGTSLTGIESLGLEFAMVTAFVAMMTPMFRHKKNIVSAVLGFSLAWLCRDWPHKTGVVFAVVVSALFASQLQFLETKESV